MYCNALPKSWHRLRLHSSTGGEEEDSSRHEKRSSSMLHKDETDAPLRHVMIHTGGVDLLVPTVRHEMTEDRHGEAWMAGDRMYPYSPANTPDKSLMSSLYVLSLSCTTSRKSLGC